MAEQERWPMRMARTVVRGIEGGLRREFDPREREHMIHVTARGAVREFCLDLPPMMDDLDCDRADGRCTCPGCGLEYRDHPQDPRVLSNAGEPFMTILCDGRRVKL